VHPWEFSESRAAKVPLISYTGIHSGRRLRVAAAFPIHWQGCLICKADLRDSDNIVLPPTIQENDEGYESVAPTLTAYRQEYIPAYRYFSLT